MCLYPQRRRNKKYLATKKNQGNIPSYPIIGQDEYNCDIIDERVAYVEYECGQCIECREKKARQWQVRMAEEVKNDIHKYFLTLTFSPEGLQEIYKILPDGRKMDNVAAKLAMRRCLERFRKRHGHSLRHWYVTELGHEGTERIHMHGILFTDEELKFEVLEEQKDGYWVNWDLWKYGKCFLGKYVSERTVNYLVKYIIKVDEVHPDYKAIVLCSPGIGRNFTETRTFKELYKYKPKDVKNWYRLPNGAKTILPKYYKNKAYNEDERELIWRESMDEDRSFIFGNKYENRDVPNETMGNILRKAKEINKSLGYGDDKLAARMKDYNITYKQLISQKRLARLNYLARKYNIDPDSPRGQRLQENVKKCLKNLED